MAAASVKRPASAKRAAPVKRPAPPPKSLELDDIQGIVASAYTHQPFAGYVLLRVGNDASKARHWLGQLATHVTAANGKSEDCSFNVALTVTGLRKLGLSEARLVTFSVPFFQGMDTPRRARILKDRPQRWTWGTGHERVHILLLVYTKTPETRDAAVGQLLNSAASAGCEHVKTLEGQIHSDRREHFGFMDGIGEPVMESLLKPGDVPRAANVVKDGEFVLGYMNGYGSPAEIPDLGPTRDLGRNGTYLVFRQTSQDVPGFWKFLNDLAHGDESEQLRLAAKLVGRWKNGAPLVDTETPEDPKLAGSDDFGFAKDPLGFRCPLGAHIRRANPRDALLNHSPEESINIASRHRLLRRGRPYGARYDAATGNETAERGLHFIALCADLERQFEFIQQTWLNNHAFNDLDEVDPLVGSQTGKGPFTIQADPARRRLLNMQSFVQVVGGAYFFVPSIKALHWLATF